MNEHLIKTAQAGEEEDFIWVSLHFESPENADDRIHIVCATSTDEQDKRLSMNAIYVERLHQGQSGYGLASRVRVSPSAVELEFTSDGLHRLEFSGSLRLLWSPALEGYEHAQHHFARMPHHECGKVVEIS